MPASADWLLSPFLGVRFAANSTFIVGAQTPERSKFTFGSSIGFLTDAGFGAEADLGFVPGFFEGASITQGSRVFTLMGNVIAAVPLELVQYGLRPYVIGGIGLMQARAEGDLESSLISSNLFGMNVGGGAIGPLSPRTSVRFDVRYFRSLNNDESATVLGDGGAQLSFWRATAGLSFRF